MAVVLSLSVMLDSYFLYVLHVYHANRFLSRSVCLQPVWLPSLFSCLLIFTKMAYKLRKTRLDCFSYVNFRNVPDWFNHY
jgi:hypothetical protein